MSSKTTKIVLGVIGVLVLAVVGWWLLGRREGGPLIPGLGDPAKCPLTGLEAPESKIGRPAVAIKIENSPAAYPLSGLEKADLVFEELVEGGFTRFMAVYHCGEGKKAGPVRSSREVDPIIMSAITRILGASGGNDAVRRQLEREGIFLVDEDAAGDAMFRVERPGISFEHTLYANPAKVRKIGSKDFDDPPPDDYFEFGDINKGARRARTISINFTENGRLIEWRFRDGSYVRFDEGEELPSESGVPITADNVIIETHTINFSNISDVVGAPSVVIQDGTGSGEAALFRNGRVVLGTWSRESAEDPVVFTTKSGDTMVLQTGRTWIELVPNDRGEVKGSYDYAAQ